MRVNELNVVVIDDDIFKAINIKRALENNGISKVTLVGDQESFWSLLKEGKHFDLIVTDMHYPLQKGKWADPDAGFILIEKMKEMAIDIPIIICSTRNFQSSDAWGTVWYSELMDISVEFRKLLKKLLNDSSL